MNSIENLAEFYKHCLNITANQRPNYNACPLFSGWMRCYITPYLIIIFELPLGAYHVYTATWGPFIFVTISWRSQVIYWYKYHQN